MRSVISRTLSVIIENDPGILIRILGLLTRRRFELETILVGEVDDKNFKRLILVIKDIQKGSDEAALQLVKQLRKLINVIDVKDISLSPKIERELLLIKLQVNLKDRASILQLVSLYNLKILDINSNTISLETTGNPSEINNIEELLKEYQILELTRTGKITLLCDENTNYNIHLISNNI